MKEDNQFNFLVVDDETNIRKMLAICLETEGYRVTAVSNFDDALAEASALIKLSGDNLTNLHPHPLYAKFYYSHPPVVERVQRLRQNINKKTT